MDKISIISEDKTVIINGRAVFLENLDDMLPDRRITAVQIQDGKSSVEFAGEIPKDFDLEGADFSQVLSAARAEMRLQDTPPTLEEAKAEALRQIARAASDLRTRLAGTGDAAKLVGYIRKAERAGRVLAGIATEADMAAIADEAASRDLGERPEQLAQMQNARAFILDRLTVQVDGLERAAESRVSEAKRNETAESVVGWFNTEAAREIAAITKGAE